MEKDLINRFIQMRKELGLTQAKFGKLLGVSDVTISKIESGQININEKHKKMVCGTLGISETWLETGQGPMFAEEIPGQKRLLEIFRQLSPEGRKTAIKVIEALLDLELERAFDEGVRAGNQGLAKDAAQNAPGGATRPPEAPQEAEKGEEERTG
jgi:transcriptional regulator with XRE-family HTH domain